MGDPRFPGDAMFIRPATFAARLDQLASLGYPVVSLHEAVEGLRHRRPLPACATVITIDDGWYGSYAYMAPALADRRLPATLYCDTAQLLAQQPIWHVMARYLHYGAGQPPLTVHQQALLDKATNLRETVRHREQAMRDFGASLEIDVDALLRTRAFSYMTPDEMRHMHADGHVDVQLHTHAHTLHDMSHAAVEGEIVRNTEVLSEILGVAASHFRQFCYPSGVTSDQAAATLESLGIAGSVTCDPGIALPEGSPQLLPRFLDGDNVYDVELEAELSGFMHLLRRAYRA